MTCADAEIKHSKNNNLEPDERTWMHMDSRTLDGT